MDNREKIRRLLELDDELLTALEYHGIVNYRDVAQHYADGGEVHINGIKISKPNFVCADSVYSKVISEIQYQGLEVRCNPPLEEADDGQTVFYVDEKTSKGYASLPFYKDILWHGYVLKRGVFFSSEEDVKAIVKAKIESGQWES